MIDMNEEHHATEANNTEGKWQDAYLDDPELANSPVLETFKTDRDALKGLVELKAYQGRSVALVKPDASPEEKSDLVKKLRNAGVDITYMPDTTNPEDMKRFREEHGVPKDGNYVLPKDADVTGMPQEGIDAAIKLSQDMGHTTEQHEAFVAALNTYNLEAKGTSDLAATEMDNQLTKILGDARPALEGVLAEAVTKHQHPDMPAEPFTPAQQLVMINLMKSISVDPQSFDQINNPNTGPTPAEIRVTQADLWAQLTDNGGRNLTKQQKIVKNAAYRKTFADLAKFK